ncbi:uncharacterized protein LOC114883172 [Osmia bicornis bicornis]|uniref:uncharacterized protein LOC114883172 n=1 Tax=Osmia bicornis bicornis TaxID=1437191 RepID=UPI0010F8A413|nr:uncharacterized protein LOC114883172 [Osmia bicornis bicornis]
MANILTYCGTRQSDCLVSFLVVGAAELCQKIADGLHQCAKERNWHISVHQCELINQVLQSHSNLGIDFIILSFDWKIAQSVSEVETNISLIDQQYILSGAACLVSCKGISNCMGLTFHISTKIQEKYNIKLLCANVYKPQGCVQLGNRILNIAESVLGMTNGIPTSALVIH